MAKTFPEKGHRAIIMIPNRPSRKGTIIGEGRTGRWWNIHLDGNKSKSIISVSKSYVKLEHPNA